jgi:hypothetical protein
VARSQPRRLRTMELAWSMVVSRMS